MNENRLQDHTELIIKSITIIKTKGLKCKTSIDATKVKIYTVDATASTCQEDPDKLYTNRQVYGP